MSATVSDVQETISLPSASRMRHSSSLQLVKACTITAVCVAVLHAFPSGPLITHDPLQTNPTPLMYTAPEPWVPQHAIQPAALQQLRLSEQRCAPRLINASHELRVRDSVGTLHHAVSFDARAAGAEEVDEDALQRLGDVVLVDVHAQVAQLDEQAETDVPVQALEYAFAHEVTPVVQFRSWSGEERLLQRRGAEEAGAEAPDDDALLEGWREEEADWMVLVCLLWYVGREVVVMGFVWVRAPQLDRNILEGGGSRKVCELGAMSWCVPIK